MKKVIPLLSGFIALMLAMPVAAQRLVLHAGDKLAVKPKTTPLQKAQMEKRFRASYPLLAQMKTLKGASSTLKEIKPVVPYRSVAAAAGRASSGLSAPTFWPVLCYSDAWPEINGTKEDLTGVISFTPTEPPFITTDTLVCSPTFASYGGAAIVNGIYYKANFDLSFISYGEVFANLFSYDVSDWEPTEGNGKDISDHIDLFATDVAQAHDGTVYGQFFTSDLNAMEYGIVDYEKLSRTTIGEANITMVALGVTNDGLLYGIGYDGNLYKISTENGQETLVGPTGLTLTDAEGYYRQTGEIDDRDNTFYWAAIDVDGNCGLYTVDLTTGAATKIGDYDAGKVMLFDMIQAGRLAPDGAPAAVTDVSESFPNGSTDGTVSFRTPATTYAGDPLTGDVSYTVTANGITVATGTAAPATTITKNLSNMPEGTVKFVFTTSNSAGTSPRVTIAPWIGYDIPVTPAKVNFTLSDNNLATVSWDAVTAGVHNAYMGNITYNVVRIAGEDTTTVAASTTQTTLTDQLPVGGSMQRYHYAVRAVNDGRKYGNWTDSEGKLLGDAFDIPYLETFDTPLSADLFTIIDANNDGSTWQYDKSGRYMSVIFQTTQQMDDWLITPPIKMIKGRNYKLTFKTHGSPIYFERIAVSMGKENTVEGMTKQIVGPTDLHSDTTLTTQFSVADDANYYVGFHGISDPEMFKLYVDSISIEVTVLPTSPAAPAIDAEAGAKGALKAQLTITAPTKQVNGETLKTGALSCITLSRNGEAIHTFTNPANGATLSYEDVVPTNGTYKYIATPYSGDEPGEAAAKELFVGKDVPRAPQHLKVIDNATSANLSWDAIDEMGVNGGYVDPAEVKTFVYDVDSMGEMSAEPLASVSNGTQYAVSFNTNEGEQQLRQWALCNANALGKSTFSSISLPVGKPSELPFIESVPRGEETNKWWTNRTGGSRSTNAWTTTTEDAADADGGSFVYKATQSNVESTLNSFKISLGNATRPMLIFSYKLKDRSGTTNGNLQVEITTPDGASTSVFSKSFTLNQVWTQELVDLSSYVGKQWIMVSFRATANEKPVTVGLDKIRILNACDDDLSAELSTQERVVKGQDIDALVSIYNNGVNEKTCTVKVYAGDELVNTEEISTPIPAFTNAMRAFTIHTSSVAQRDKDALTLKAVVETTADEKPENNTAQATVQLDNSDLPAPEDLTAEASNHLMWKAPAVKAVTITDDFEQYVPFAYPFGDWTTIDGNPGAVLAAFSDMTYPGQNQPGSFLLFDADAIRDGMYNSNTVLRGHGASHRFAGMPYETSSADYSFVDGDNYLVSPELSGEAQTINFYVRNAFVGSWDFPETFEVLASTTGNSKEDFTTTVLDAEQISGGLWKNIIVSLPKGTTYFAIHQMSSGEGSGNYLFSVDDVTFDVGSGKPVAYNVYADDAYLGTTKDGKLDYQVAVALTGSHKWAVTAVYPDGQESAPAELVADDIRSVSIDGKPFDVYTTDGALVARQLKDLRSLKPGVYIINNRKIIK